MKKLFATAIISTLLIVPTFAAAQTTTTTDNSALIAVLEQLVQTLTQELNQLLANRASGASASQAPATTVTPSVNYSSYAPVSMALYSANTSAYNGDDVVVTGMVNTFMPKGGNGGTTNYIQIINPFDQSQPKLQLEVDDGGTYTAAVTSLQDTSSPIYQFVRAYGTGVPDQQLTETSLFGSTNIAVPVVNVTRIDKCIHGTMNDTVLTGTSFDSNFTCTSWETIAPSSSAGTVSGVPAPTTTPQPTATIYTSPISISTGQSATLAWYSTNATSCTGVGFTANGTNGYVSVSPANTTTYSLTCTGVGGHVTESVTLPVTTNTVSTSVPPKSTCNLSISPSSIANGQSSQLSWTSVNATAGSISGVGSLSSLNGSMSVSPPASTNYTATFSGSGGSINCSTAVSVTQPSKTTTLTPTPASNLTITSISPTSGSTAGGDDVQIDGTGFGCANETVSFGGRGASFGESQGVGISAWTPSGTAGPTDVTVTSDCGTVTAHNGFTYVYVPPAITSISPNSGSITGGSPTGGNNITIYGVGFQVGVTVTIGGAKAINVYQENETTIGATTPPGTVGPADVVVTNPDGSTATLSGGYTYTSP